MNKNLPITDIISSTELQTRSKLDESTVADYAETMQSGKRLPPVVVFTDGKALWLVDGFHRVEAARTIGRHSVVADVRTGTYADALKFALGANANHGLRRTNADKQKALEMAWAHRRELWPREDNADPSAAVLADACGISVRMVECFVAKIQPPQNVEVAPPKERRLKPPARGSATQPPPPVRKVFGMDGKTRAVPVPVAATIKPSVPVPKARPGYYIAQDGKEHAIGVMLDRYGNEIPKRIEGAFKDGNVRDKIETHLRTAANLLKQAMGEKDSSVAQFRQADLIELQNAVRTAKFTRPYCVCRYCQGEGCKVCRETGFMTKFQYDRTDESLKAENEAPGGEGGIS